MLLFLQMVHFDHVSEPIQSRLISMQVNIVDIDDRPSVIGIINTDHAVMPRQSQRDISGQTDKQTNQFHRVPVRTAFVSQPTCHLCSMRRARARAAPATPVVALSAQQNATTHPAAFVTLPDRL